MSRLVWGLSGVRFFETGVDRGVLYPKTGDGVVWNGLISVTENPSGGQPRPYYFDGYKYLNVAEAEEFSAGIEAFSAPLEFSKCEGSVQVRNGLFAGQQTRETFGFSYRTMIGNDTDGTDHGYKIHLVYNALASATSRTNTSVGKTVDPIRFSWTISTAPVIVPGFKYSAHLAIDSRRTPFAKLVQIENILYGTSFTEPRLPSVEEIMTIFAAEDALIVIDNLDGTYSAEGTAVSLLTPGFQIDSDQVADNGDGTFTITY